MNHCAKKNRKYIKKNEEGDICEAANQRKLLRRIFRSIRMSNFNFQHISPSQENKGGNQSNQSPTPPEEELAEGGGEEQRKKRMLQAPILFIRRPVTVALILTGLIFAFFFAVSAESSNNSRAGCSKSCVAENCNSVGIRYGKYCGVGWSGCPGEKPCDDLDACCKIHDECVEKKGLTDVKCHEKFKRCIKKVQKSGKVGFSRDCPYDTAVPTMVQGMDLAIMFSQLGNSKLEL